MHTPACHRSRATPSSTCEALRRRHALKVMPVFFATLSHQQAQLETDCDPGGQPRCGIMTRERTGVCFCADPDDAPVAPASVSGSSISTSSSTATHSSTDVPSAVAAGFLSSLGTPAPLDRLTAKARMLCNATYSRSLVQESCTCASVQDVAAAAAKQQAVVI